MALRSKRTPEPVIQAPRSMIASAAKMPADGFTWNIANYTQDKTWQSEAWRFYDCVGELHSIGEWIGSACGRVRITINNIDELGQVGGEVIDDPEIEALGASLLGGPSSRAEVLANLGTSLTIAGESYLIGRTVGNRNRWATASALELNSTGTKAYLADENGKSLEISKRSGDIVIRIWTPHPSNNQRADSPTMSALRILSQLEKLTRFTDSQLDSRIANGMVWLIPSNLDFPTDDDQSVAEAVLQAILDAMTAALTGSGQAAGVTPIIIEIPADISAPIAELLQNPIRFESILSQEAASLREESVGRLARAMNIPPEVLLGMGQTANHFNIWHVEESAVKIYVEPLMNRICEALTVAWLTPALIKLGKDPSQYTYWYDTASLTVRPNRLADTLNLYEKGIVSAEAVRKYGDYKEDDAPDDGEISSRRTFEVVLRDPTLFNDQAVREEAGMHVETSAQQAQAMLPPPPPVPELEGNNVGPAPFTDLPDVAGQAPDAATASLALVSQSSPLIEAAHQTVRRALELAGNRIVPAQQRKTVWAGLDRCELHTKVKVESQDHADKLLAGAWDYARADARELGVDPNAYSYLLQNYTRTLLLRSTKHEKTMLASLLRDAELLG